MPLQVGVNVLEVDSHAHPPSGANLAVAAFVGRTQRGVPDRAVRITDPSQFLARNGAPRADAYTGLAVLGLFLERWPRDVRGPRGWRGQHPRIERAEQSADACVRQPCAQSGISGRARSRSMGQRVAD